MNKKRFNHMWVFIEVFVAILLLMKKTKHILHLQIWWGNSYLRFIIGENEIWENTQIVNGVRSIEAKDQRITSVCGQEIIRIMENAEHNQEQLSDKQQEKIKQRLQKAAAKSKNILFGTTSKR